MNAVKKRRKVKRIIVTVKKVNGCVMHKPGDKIVFERVNGSHVHIHGTICLEALTSIMPKVYSFYYNAHFPWADKDDVVVQCPTPETFAVFEVKREYE
mgnify:CR=1 FL=1